MQRLIARAPIACMWCFRSDYVTRNYSGKSSRAGASEIRRNRGLLLPRHLPMHFIFWGPLERPAEGSSIMQFSIQLVWRHLCAGGLRHASVSRSNSSWVPTCGALHCWRDMDLVTYNSTLCFCWDTCAPENTRFARCRHLENHMARALFPGWFGPVTAHRPEEAQVATLMH